MIEENSGACKGVSDTAGQVIHWWVASNITNTKGVVEQDRLGLALVTLIEDPEGATIQRLVAEAVQASAAGAAGPRGGSQRGSLWIAPAPVSVKLRLFCLPYAGGVSENVFGRSVEARLHACAPSWHCSRLAGVLYNRTQSMVYLYVAALDSIGIRRACVSSVQLHG